MSVVWRPFFGENYRRPLFYGLCVDGWLVHVVWVPDASVTSRTGGRP